MNGHEIISTVIGVFVVATIFGVFILAATDSSSKPDYSAHNLQVLSLACYTDSQVCDNDGYYFKDDTNSNCSFTYNATQADKIVLYLMGNFTKHLAQEINETGQYVAAYPQVELHCPKSR